MQQASSSVSVSNSARLEGSVASSHDSSKSDSGVTTPQSTVQITSNGTPFDFNDAEQKRYINVVCVYIILFFYHHSMTPLPY